MQIGKNLFALCGLLAVTVSATTAQSPMPAIVPVANANAAGVAQPSKPVVADEGDEASGRIEDAVEGDHRATRIPDDRRLTGTDAIEHREHVGAIREGDVLGRRGAVAADVVADHAVAGRDERRHHRVPGTQVDDRARDGRRQDTAAGGLRRPPVRAARAARQSAPV